MHNLSNFVVIWQGSPSFFLRILAGLNRQPFDHSARDLAIWDLYLIWIWLLLSRGVEASFFDDKAFKQFDHNSMIGLVEFIVSLDLHILNFPKSAV